MIKKLAVIFLFLPLACFAEWTIVGVNDSSIHYLDFSTISKEGSLVRAWDLIDLEKFKINSKFDTYNSTKSYIEYDCKKRKFQYLSISQYSEKGAAGNVVFTAAYNDPDWQYIGPGEMIEIKFKAACGLKK